MRIRKHAKISPLVYAASSLKPGTVIQTHVCLLNQSPWDVMTFPPSSDPTTPPPPPPPAFHEVDKDDSYMANGTFAEYIGADESAASLKFGLEDEKPKWDNIGVRAARNFDSGGAEAEAEKEDHLSLKQNGEEFLCCKSDGKGWQCRRKAKEGHSLCEHHASQLKNKSYSNNYLGNPTVKKSDKASESGRRTRPKKPSSSSNPHEFYYYSGFGPRWGKKRGPTTTTAAEPYASAGSTGSDTSKNNFLGVYEHYIPEPNAAIAAPSSQIDNEGVDYVEDEEDDEDNEESGKKRARKPIKARSLKSLM